MSDLVQFLQKLRSENFTGEMVVHFSRGHADAIELTRHIPREEYDLPEESEQAEGQKQ